MEVYGHKIFDWSKIHDIPFKDRKDFIIDAAVQAIMKIQKMPLSRDNVKFVGADSTLQGPVPVALVFTDTIKSPDRGYEYLFEENDMRASNNASFDILDVTGGVTFYQQEAGEEAKLSKLPHGAKVPVGMLRFTGGYNILDDWLRFNEYYKIDQLTTDTIRRWWNNRATIFYGLIIALSSAINEAFATDDVTTINNACGNILINMDAAGYPVDENERFAILCNPTLRGRIFKAIAASFVNPNANNNQIVYNIDTVISSTKVANTSYYVCLPGYKSRRGEWEDLNLRPPQRNELVLGASHVWTGAYNGAVAEPKQFRRCALS